MDEYHRVDVEADADGLYEIMTLEELCLIIEYVEYCYFYPLSNLTIFSLL